MDNIKPSTILLIDDDEKLGQLLTEYLAKFNIKLLTATRPGEGLKQFEKYNPDLIILDIMLPEMDGFDVCRHIRQKSNTPVIILTARGDVNDRVVGLGIGADDYLPKPFDPRELVARIEGILARVQQPLKGDDEIVKFHRLTINKSSYEVRVDEQLIELTTKEYALLLLMCEHPEKVYNRDDIMNELSGIDSELFSRSVDILVSRLRNKLKPLKYIQTVWGTGYKFSDISE
ncbi:MAG: DNA-binding response regulator [Gammaproteobacteria bacterium]|nr:MAG: DNA-binding response regulator [Gammaproteobacteria bacterium]